MTEKLECVISSRETDLGGFTVRRVLPFARHRSVGPFVFFDHMGPATFPQGQGMDVRPHPHIGLSTVTYLFDGDIFHRDSLGSQQCVSPGCVGWMTAGKGIVHSERTPLERRQTGGVMNGIQAWVALPDEYEETSPSFVFHAADAIPQFEVGNVKVRLIAGSAFGRVSPVKTHSPLFYLELRMPKGTRFDFSTEGQECGAYVVDGKVMCANQEIAGGLMAVLHLGDDLSLAAVEDSHVMIAGGKSVGTRYLWWNLVASSKEKLEAAKLAWKNGPDANNSFFHPIPGDDQEFIELPST